MIAFLLAFTGGALFDFLVYGVAKIIWAVVYVPLYVVVASILHTQLTRSAHARHFKMAFVGFVAGALVARVALVHRHRQATYVMAAGGSQPFTLHSEDWPRTLLVTSEALAKDLSAKPAGRALSVVVDVVSDYGCISSFQVRTIDGVNVENDPSATWTWRDPSVGATSGPGLEDQELPWCRIQLYRSGANSSKQGDSTVLT